MIASACFYFATLADALRTFSSENDAIIAQPTTVHL